VSAGGGWRPSASLRALRARAELLAAIRAFFAERGVLEVDCPALGAAGAPDAWIEPFRVRTPHGPRFLHTSPELAMKRLLAAGSGDIYFLGHVYRAGEWGRRHNPEFTLLEWYRLGWDHHRLMEEVAALVAALFPPAAEHPPEKLTYETAFRRSLGIDPWTAGAGELARVAGRRGLTGGADWDRAAWLDLLFAEIVARDFPADRLTLVHDFPPEQAALARLREGPRPRAERFELFWGPMELANGFHELTDAVEQRARFEGERTRRRAAGLPEVPPDARFLAALEAGLPDCAGVALGVDRLLMEILGADQIGAVLPFDWSRA